MRISLGQLVIHSLCGNVFLPEEGTENQLTLACELELMLSQVLLQRRHFFHMLPHHGPPIRLIKDQTAYLVKGVLCIIDRRWMN